MTSAAAVIVVCTGAWWLVRSPPPRTEATLPVATLPASSVPLDSTPARVSTTVPDGVVVHVAGAVAEPGVYEVEPGSRVVEAIERAGGVTEGADAAALNLAAIFPDGARIVVPLKGEPVPPDVIFTSGAADGTDGPRTPGALVNVNRATASELEALPGVGPATAAAIVDERTTHGPFVSIADLERVPGIGPVRLAALSELVTT